jgi:hypothetical protein
MMTSEILDMLDEEIRLLERAKALLSEAEPAARRRGRPKGSTNQQTSFNPSEFVAAKLRRKLGAAARERIAAAQRARWAKLKGTPPKKPAGKKTSAPKRAGKSPGSSPAKKPAGPVEATA